MVKLYTINKDFFSRIETEPQAYWLGFIAADGSICNKELKIDLAKKDEKHLIKFLVSLNSSHPIHNYNGFSSVVCIAVQQLVNDLKKLNVKTKLPDINYELLSHYYRGLVDGDGCLSISKDGNFIVNLVGAKPFCDGFLSFVQDNGINTISTVKPLKSIFSISISGKENAKKISNALYKDSSIYLDRKYEKAAIMGGWLS
jgi:hypothetical protein